MEVTHQIGVFLALTEGLLDEVPLEKIREAEMKIMNAVDGLESFKNTVMENEKVEGGLKEEFLSAVRAALSEEGEA